MNKKRQRQIEEKVESLIQKTSQTSPKIDLHKIAEIEDIQIKGHNFSDDVSGLLVMKDGKVTIGFNNNHVKTRQRFTIAHELGHYFLEHQRGGLFIDENKQFSVMFRDGSSSKGEILQEIEANAFAAALLMPSRILKEKVREYKFDLAEETDLISLAKLFGVSTQAMAFRISNLNLLEI